eukprot:gene11576-15501_t
MLSSMAMLSLTLQKSSAISTAVYGNFTGPKQQEIVVAKGNILELLRPDDTGKVISICSTNVFAIIRSILPFRLSGANKDYIVVGSDSGKISILEFDLKINDWKIVHCEVFGKTGCRRIVPGQYLAADPKGRSLLIAGVEKQKFVYVMNRDGAGKLTISSPLEAHKSETILFSVVGVDVGFENPVYAMIELEYTEADQDSSGVSAQEVEKKLTYYELDLGLNHVVRKWSEPISRTANFLLSVPGGDVWPSGVLICGENWISYKHQGHVEVRTALPRRVDIPIERGILITSGTVHKQKDLFFFILQSEFGDLYKVTLELDPTDSKIVQDVIVTVFDTIQPSNSLCITKTGLLYTASEFGNHSLYQFQGIDDPNAVRSSKVLDEELNEELGDDSISASRVAPIFKASSKMQNLLMTDDIDSLAPITDMLVEDVTGENSCQVYALCGKGNRSSLRILRRGASVTEMAVSELPGKPLAVWTVKKSVDDSYDQYIVVSFVNLTLVLSIGDTVEEITDSGFLGTSSTLQVVLLADNALLQVHSNGIRHIRPDKRMSEWKSAGKILIASANSRQVAVALSGGEIIYFELDPTGQLTESGTIDMGKEISCMDLGLVPNGRVRSSFLAVGCWDDSVQLLSLDPSDLLGKGPSMNVESRPTSLCLVEMSSENKSSQESSSAAVASSTLSTLTTLYLNIGLEKGVLQRVAVDSVSGDFSDRRVRFLGPKAVKLCRVTMQGSQSVLALTTKPWLLYNYQNRYHQDPISYDMIEHACDFSSEACPDAIVAVAGNTLRIFTIDNLGELFNQTTIPLRYTPRKMCSVAHTKELLIIETDHNEYNEEEKLAIAAAQKEAPLLVTDETSAAMTVENKDEGDNNNNKSNNDNYNQAEEDVEEGTTIAIRGPIPASDGKWASCIRLLDPSSKTTRFIMELSQNEAAFSITTCKFTAHSEETFVIVGSCKDLTLHPKRYKACFISVYRLLDDTLSLLHQTEVEDVPLAMLEFQGKLLVGIGKCLRLYDLGKRKLLKKCENKMFPSNIVRIQSMGDRIYVGDMAESVHFVKYKRQENATLNIFADDSIPRFITSICVVDYHTVAAVDKFGNVFVLRLPKDANDDLSTGGNRLLWDQGMMNGAPNKLELLACFFLGETATSIQATTFQDRK